MPGEIPFLLGTTYLASTGVRSYWRARRRPRYKGIHRRGWFR